MLRTLPAQANELNERCRNTVHCKRKRNVLFDRRRSKVNLYCVQCWRQRNQRLPELRTQLAHGERTQRQVQVQRTLLAQGECIPRRCAGVAYASAQAQCTPTTKRLPGLTANPQHTLGPSWSMRLLPAPRSVGPAVFLGSPPIRNALLFKKATLYFQQEHPPSTTSLRCRRSPGPSSQPATSRLSEQPEVVDGCRLSLAGFCTLRLGDGFQSSKVSATDQL